MLEREVVSVYDHRHLNLEVPEFCVDDADDGEHRDRNLASGWRTRLRDAKLHRVRVYEMPDLFADYYGEL